MAKTSPTQRSLAHLRKLGLTCAVVEKWNPHAMIRQDLFGCLDLVALDPNGARLTVPPDVTEGFCNASIESGIYGVQTTSSPNLAARRKKALAEPRLRTWLEAGGRFVLHAWSKKGPRGKRKQWTLTEEEITLADLPMETLGIESSNPQGPASSNGALDSHSPANETAKPAGGVERY